MMGEKTMMNLTHERDALALALLQDDRDEAFTYRECRDIATDELIDTLAYAIRWNQRAAAARNGNGYEPEDMPPAPPIENPDTEADEGPRARARDKALWHIANGLQVARDWPDWLVPSGTRTGLVHRVTSDGRCNCEAAAHGRVCWHAYVPQLYPQRRRAA